MEDRGVLVLFNEAFFFLHQHLSVRDAEINAIMMREDIKVAVTLQRHCDLDQSVHGNAVFPGGSHYSPSVGGCHRSFKHQFLNGTMRMSIAFCQISINECELFL